MSSATRLRVRPNGIAVIAASIALVALSVATGYVELALIAIVGLIIVGLALLWPRVTSPIAFERIDAPRLVSRGDEMAILLSASVTRTSPPTSIIDQLSGFSVPIALPEIRADVAVLVRYRIRALRRGVHQLGPLLEERSDPLALVTRTVQHDVIDEVLVHPVIHRLGLTETGSLLRQSRARVARLSDDPLADFRSLREYVVGDDERLVHWPTVARTGTLMVRDHFELRRTTRTVILETLDRTATDGLFEEAVEIAASIVCESLSRDIVVTARTRDRGAPGRTTAVHHRIDALELFTRVRRTDIDDTVTAAKMQLGRDPSDQIFLVAGAASPLIGQLAASRSIRRRLVVIRLDDGSAPMRPLPIRCTDVASAEEFVGSWNRGAMFR
jgi:uncharacterized protein (DUF58 family)